MQLKWELPGGKVRYGETPEAALEREILGERAVTIQVGPLLGSGSSSTSSKKIRFDVYTARLVAGNPHPHEHSAIRWVSGDELGELDWAEADVPALPTVAKLLGRGSPSDSTNP